MGLWRGLHAHVLRAGGLRPGSELGCAGDLAKDPAGPAEVWVRRRGGVSVRSEGPTRAGSG